MKVIVVGAGEVGFHLAKMLSNENHDIVIIEDKQENCLKAQENLDVIAIQGNGASIEKLIEAGVKDADMLIAVSNSDLHLPFFGLPDFKGLEPSATKIHLCQLNIRSTWDSRFVHDTDFVVSIFVNRIHCFKNGCE